MVSLAVYYTASNQILAMGMAWEWGQLNCSFLCEIGDACLHVTFLVCIMSSDSLEIQEHMMTSLSLTMMSQLW